MDIRWFLAWRARSFLLWFLALLAVAFLVGVVLLLHSNWRFWPTIRRAKRHLRATALQRCENVRVIVRQGPPDISARYIWFFIATNTDAEAHKLREDASFLPALRAGLLAAGFPADAVPYVHLLVESQETVDRDYNGDWNEAMEMP